jgi:putative transposase
VTRYRWIDARKAEGFYVAAACEVAGVCTSAYYEWRAQIEAGAYETLWSEAIVVNEILDVHRGLDDTYGSPRMTTELRRRGICANHKRVERLMRENGIVARDARRKKVRTTIPDVTAPPLPDLVKRDFAVGEPGRRTCGDITYVATDEGWCYVASVLDLGSRRVVGFAIDERMPTELISRALDMAVLTRGGDVKGMVFHHDRGTQYLSKDFRELCEHHGISQSVGRIGSSHDNAVAESFWATMKRECVHRQRFESRADARRAIIAWINRYNAVRLHSSLGNVTPIEWELRFAVRQLQAA